MDSYTSVEHFGKLPDGRNVLAYTMRNSAGMELTALNYGGTVTRLVVPGPDGALTDVAIGFLSLETYLKEPYYGSLIGRVGNRIAFGRFTLEGKDYQIATNNAPGDIPCSLHGGEEGFNAKIWAVTPSFDGDDPVLTFKLRSEDGDQGYPGNLDLTVTYTLTASGIWRITYNATTDKATPVNLTQHAYFNLKGEGKGDVLDHLLQLNAKTYLPVNPGLIPLGEPAPVAGTPFDFTQPRALGEAVDADDDQIRHGAGYDHTFVIDKGDGLARAATLQAPGGIAMEVWTTEPGVQIYTGNYIPDGLAGKSGPYIRRGGVALETQHYPDSLNQPAFPSIVLQPGAAFESTTEYRFSVNP